jgi:HlyD family secretion protein
MDEPLRRSWRRRNAARVAKLLAALALVAAVATATRHGGGASLRVPADLVTIEPARRGLFHDVTSLQGHVVPRDTISLDALEGGRVERVMARTGDRVSAGQPLVEFSNTQLELDILAQEGRLIESITQLQAYEQQLEQNRSDNDRTLAQVDHDRVRVSRALGRRIPLAERGFVPRETMDRLEDELRSIVEQHDIQTARRRRQETLRVRQQPQIDAQLATLRRSLDITRAKLDDLTVRAPAAGRLTGLDLNIGESRNPGDRLGTIILDTGFRISAKIDEYYLDRVRVGQQARVEVNGRPTGLVVSRIHPQVESGTFTVELEFRNGQPGRLVAGEAMRGSLSLGEDRPAVVLPAGAFLEQTGGDWAFVVAADGTHAERRRIRAGRRNAGQVEILTGLAPGERVITSSYAGWEGIQRIRLVE